MWGIRAIRVGMLLGGLVTAVAGCGAMNTGVPLIPSRDQSSTPRNLQSQEDTGDTKSGADEVRPGQAEWKRTPADWGFKDQKALTPERIHGGIY